MLRVGDCQYKDYRRPEADSFIWYCVALCDYAHASDFCSIKSDFISFGKRDVRSPLFGVINSSHKMVYPILKLGS